MWHLRFRKIPMFSVGRKNLVQTHSDQQPDVRTTFLRILYAHETLLFFSRCNVFELDYDSLIEQNRIRSSYRYDFATNTLYRTS